MDAATALPPPHPVDTVAAGGDDDESPAAAADRTATTLTPRAADGDHDGGDAAEAERWLRTRSHPLYPQLVNTIAENSIEGLPPQVAAARQPRVMAPPLTEEDAAAVEITESVDFFVKDTLHHIAQNTEGQRNARIQLEAAGAQLLAELDQPVEHRMQGGDGGEAAAAAAAAAPKRTQEDMKRLFMDASAKIQRERKERGKNKNRKKKPRAE
jgi:hypothetical protein|eukprot:COSAG06_NODE_25_length_32611_cov_10.451160_22_plen_212_part_00